MGYERKTKIKVRVLDEGTEGGLRVALLEKGTGNLLRWAMEGGALCGGDGEGCKRTKRQRLV